MAACTDDAIIPYVFPFVREHLMNLDWRLRDAAIMALGCIMEGPDPDHLSQYMTDVSIIFNDTIGLPTSLLGFTLADIL